ncbi:hypothetical protein HYW75_03795 [Candidatus Pacearchaeota archaeon]|nr:hypothetical protein [Candidatus Pacearchaeota archaeon]
MRNQYNFDRYLERTIQITRELTLDQIQKQWKKMNYEYRIRKLRKFINYTFVSAFIIGIPIVTYNELNKIIDMEKEMINQSISVESKVME